LKGLSYYHTDRKQLHRDVKPDNILVSSQVGEAKLSDFGISKELEATLNMCNTFVGTLSYMSPERMDGKQYSFSSDIWSIGMVVYEMTTGINPYPENNPLELHEHIMSRPSPSLAGVPKLSPEIVDFVAKW